MAVRMMPIDKCLSRIRRDPQFAASRFVVGCRERVAARGLRADLRENRWDADNPGYFDLMHGDA